MPQQRPDRDALDESLEIWAREIPDLDPLTEGIIERIQILAFNVDQSLDQTLAEFELDRRSFGLLGKLRRHGPPYQVSAGKLAAELRLSSGAMTNRLDRMEAAGLVRRLPDPNDRRGTLVEPTEEGHAAWDKTVGAQARREVLFSSVLTDTEKERLHDLLRHMMLAFPDWKHKKHGAHDAADAPAHDATDAEDAAQTPEPVTTGRATAGRATAGKATAGKATAGKATAGKATAGKASA